jgi:hypothetical protein
LVLVDTGVLISLGCFDFSKTSTSMGLEKYVEREQSKQALAQLEKPTFNAMILSFLDSLARGTFLVSIGPAFQSGGTPEWKTVTHLAQDY